MNSFNFWTILAVVVMVSVAIDAARQRNRDQSSNGRANPPKGQRMNKLRFPRDCTTSKMVRRSYACDLVVEEKSTHNGNGLYIVSAPEITELNMSEEEVGEDCAATVLEITKRCVSTITFNGRCRPLTLKKLVNKCELDLSEGIVTDPAVAVIPIQMDTFKPDLETTNWNCWKNMRAINHLCRRDN